MNCEIDDQLEALEDALRLMTERYINAIVENSVLNKENDKLAALAGELAWIPNHEGRARIEALRARIGQL